MLKGIVPPVITPLGDKKNLDIEGLERLIEHILSGGVHGLFILGTTGEGPSLSYKIRNEVIEQVCSQVDSKVPVLVGITDTSFTESVRLSKKAAEVGADAVVAAPPYYFSMNQAELIGYYESLADESPLPLFLYNMPSHTKIHFEPETVKNLAEHSNIIGFKDSSGDLLYFQNVVRLLQDNPEFSLFVGPEEMLMQTMLTGGHGGVNGGANMFPNLYVAMYEAVLEKNFDRMTSFQKKILQISSNLYTVGNSPAKYLQGVKCALSLMGICSDNLALPYNSFKEQEREKIRHALNRFNVEEVLT
ncbi:dihydrodipicolinate synthase family protein [Rhodohalobacter sulfatireducens]|uniref:Dihydrodipicolinate synthase family protein n=1 Tax=Rhodohalobacter sulfatireducens TaxID=2911366 RepID=A0ABS9KAC7_9BACT|nr:dihydrodipicolinate synthase family protein [Rhodohalobacter sulfatireducens]MCG2587805.1 dihydrodipicolinate synthase family protein [Rhodohalobacter sulfatireducens]